MNTDQPGEAGTKQQGMSAIALTRLILDTYDFHADTGGRIFYALPGAPVVRGAGRGGQSLGGDVRRLLLAKGVSCGRDTITGAVDTVLAEAAVQPPTSIYTRAAQLSDRVVIDTGHDEFVVVTADGWHTSVDPGVIFTRGSAFAPIPAPATGGNPEQLAGLLGLDPTERRWQLIRGWLAAVFLAGTNRPLLWFHGFPGSGKSTRALLLARLVDGTDKLGSPIGKNARDDVARFASRYVPTMDNVSNINEETSDTICRLVTGAVTEVRGLYTDNDLISIPVHRTGMATSVSVPLGLRADALDRLILVEFEKGRDATDTAESELWTRWAQIAPTALGCILDDLSRVLRHLQETPTSGLSRHGDYERALRAVDIATGAGLTSALLAAANEAMVDAAESDPLISAIRQLTAARGGDWHAAPEALFGAVVDEMLRAADATRDPEARYRPTPYLPKSARGLTALLKQAREPLSAVGIRAEWGRSNGQRRWHFQTKPVTESDNSGPDVRFVSAASSADTTLPGHHAALPGHHAALPGGDYDTHKSDTTSAGPADVRFGVPQVPHPAGGLYLPVQRNTDSDRPARVAPARIGTCGTAPPRTVTESGHGEHPVARDRFGSPLCAHIGCTTPLLSSRSVSAGRCHEHRAAAA